MTKDELYNGMKDTGEIKLLKHDNNRDVAFWPLAIQKHENLTELGGIWYSLVMGDVMGTGFGEPLREVIKLKDLDLPGWKWIEVPEKD